MIPFFMGYALIVWFAAAKFRRTLWAIAVIAGGVGVLMFINFGHMLLGIAHPELQVHGLQLLMYPYSLLVAVIAIYIAVLPRRAMPGSCPRCEYDLTGLKRPTTRCPECGAALEEAVQIHHRRSGVERSDLRTGDTSPARSR